MTLTPEILEPFKGGQIEIQNQGEKYIYRGQIHEMTLEDTKLRVTFDWLARSEGWPLPKEWTKAENTAYVIDLSLCSISNIGSSGGEVGGGDRIAINYAITGELIVLYPADGSKRDPLGLLSKDLSRTKSAAPVPE